MLHLQQISETDARRKIVFIYGNERFFDRRNSGETSAFGLHQSVRRRGGRGDSSKTELVGQEINQSALVFNRQTVKIVTHTEIQRQTAVDFPISCTNICIGNFEIRSNA